MPQAIDAAKPTRLANITEELVDQKLRVMGRCAASLYPNCHSYPQVHSHSMLSYDPLTALALVYDEDAALLIDVSLCVDPYTSGRWIRERKGFVMVLGYLERSPVCLAFTPPSLAILKGSFVPQTQLAIPDLPAYAPAPNIDPTLLLRALIVRPALRDVDMALWNEAADEQAAGPDYASYDWPAGAV